MGKTINLKLKLLVIIVTLSFSIGHKNWLSPILMALNIYYLSFIMNLFFKLYDKENFITRIFMETTKTPMYLAMATMVIVIIFIRRFFPEIDFDSAYLSAFIGVTAYTIGRIKRKELIVRS